jgi:hypothetical protein
VINSSERIRLIQQYRHQPACVLAVMLRAMGGLLLIVIVTVLGMQTRSPDGPEDGDARHKMHERASVSHARQLYEERRANFQGRQKLSAVSSATSPVRVDEPQTVLPTSAIQRKHQPQVCAGDALC